MALINNLQVTSVDGTFMSLSNYVLKPEIMAQAPQRYMMDGIFGMAAFTDRLKVSGQTEYKHTEEDAIRATVTIESVAGTAGAGNPATVTIADASHANSGKLTPIQAGQQVMIDNANGRYYARVKSVNKGTDNAHTFVLEEPGVNLVADLGAADVVSIVSNSHSDGAGQPDSVASIPLELSNYTQIIKTKFEIDGSERANISWRVIDGKKYYVIMQEKRAKQSHDADINYALLLGQKRSNKTDATTGKTVYETGGLEWYAKTYGNSDTYTTLAVADLNGWDQTLDAEHVGNEVFFLQGNKLNQYVNTVLRDKNDTGGLSFAAFGNGDAQRRAVDMGFDSWRMNNRTYHDRVIKAMNAKGITQSTNLPEEGVIIPTDKFVGKDGTEDFKFTVRFKESDKENRFFKVWTRDQSITNNDKWELNMQSELGLQAFCPNEYIWVSK